MGLDHRFETWSFASRLQSHGYSHIPDRLPRTSPTICSHLIIPRSWVRSPPALLHDSATSLIALELRSNIHSWIGGAHVGSLMRQNGCPAGSEKTRSPAVSFFAPSSMTRSSASSRSSTITSRWNCCGQFGSGQLGAWKSVHNWKAMPDAVSLAEITTQSLESKVIGNPSNSE